MNPISPKRSLQRLEQTLLQGKDSLCWSLVEDLNLCHSELLLHQLPESLALIRAAAEQATPTSIHFSTIACWLEGPDLMRSVFRVLSAAIAAGNEEIWIGLPEQAKQFAGLLQLLMRPLGPGIRIVLSDAEPFIESTLGQVHTLLIQGDSRWISGWESVFARWGMRVQVEGTGNDAVCVFKGSNPQRAARMTLEAAMRNSGMDPASPHRVYVARSVYSAFSRELLRLSRDWTLGSPHCAKSDLGPLAEEEIRRVMRQLEAAFAQGARVQCGGEPRPCAEDEHLGLGPTIVTACRAEMALVQEPCRAPVLALVGFDHEADGVHMACQVPGGHSVSIFGASATCEEALQPHFGRVFCDTTPFCEEAYAARLRWGADGQTSWIWEPMPDGRLARRSGAHGLVSSLVPREARPNLPGVIPPSDEVRVVQGLAGPDGLIMLPG
jgi:hypothetical protein